MKIISIIMMMILACQSEIPSDTVSEHSRPNKFSHKIFNYGSLSGPWGSQKVWYKSTNQGSVIVQGDMKFPKDQLADSSIALHGYAVMQEDRLWPEGVIWYQYEDGLDESVKTAFENGVKVWNEKVKFQWKLKDPEQDVYHVYVKRWFEGGGLSTVGRLPEPGKNYQELLLDLDCQTRCLKHEMGHVMGLWHEHSRPDRDKFIKIYYENIDPENRAYFISGNLEDSQQLTPFDFNSIMLYGSYYLSKSNDRMSLSKLDGGLIEVTDSISDQDIASVNRLWKQWFDLKNYRQLRSALSQEPTLNQADYKKFIDTLNSGTSFEDFKDAYLNSAGSLEELKKISMSVFNSQSEGVSGLKKYLSGEGPYENLRSVLISGDAVKSELRKIWKDLRNQDLDVNEDNYIKLKAMLSEGDSLKDLRKKLVSSSEVTELIRTLFSRQLKRDPDSSELSLIGSWLILGGSLERLDMHIPETLADALWRWFYLEDPQPETISSLVAQIESGVTLEKLRDNFKQSNDFSNSIRSAVLSKLGRDVTEGEFEEIKSQVGQSPFSQVLSQFVLNHPELKSILQRLAEGVWGIAPEEEDLKNWIGQLVSGMDINQVTSEILGHERGVQTSKRVLMNLFNLDEGHSKVSEWQSELSDQWKEMAYGEHFEVQWREILIQSLIMEQEIILQTARFYRHDLSSENIAGYRDYLISNPDQSFKDLVMYILGEPRMIQTYNRFHNLRLQMDLDFKDIDENRRSLLEAGSLEQFRKDRGAEL